MKGFNKTQLKLGVSGDFCGVFFFGKDLEMSKISFLNFNKGGRMFSDKQTQFHG